MINACGSTTAISDDSQLLILFHFLRKNTDLAFEWIQTNPKTEFRAHVGCFKYNPLPRAPLRCLASRACGPVIVHF